MPLALHTQVAYQELFRLHEVRPKPRREGALSLSQHHGKPYWQVTRSDNGQVR